MNIQGKDFLSALPVIVLFTSGIFSYSTLSADASQTAEQAQENKTEIAKIDETVNELDKRISMQEGRMQRVQQDIDTIAGDTKQILGVLMQRSQSNKSD